MALLLLLAFCSCAQEYPATSAHTVHPYYDGSAFSQSDGRYRYDDGQTMARRTGIDVSDHQGNINWAAVAADGIDFAFIRVGYRGNTKGGLYPDERFATNVQEARDAGIACGAYFFSQAISVDEAKEEAAFVLDHLGDTQLDYPVAFDYEVMASTRIAGVSTQTATEVATTFCTAIRAGGYEPMLYGNTFDLARFDSQLREEYAIWCAEYDDGPSYEQRMRIWQYTNKGTVNGINAFVDLNLDLGNAEV